MQGYNSDIPNIESYKPGVCNIGKAQRNRRRQAGIFFILFSVSFTFIAYVFNFSLLLKITVFIPMLIGTLSLIQYQQKFCVYLGYKGVYNFDQNSKEIIINNQDYYKKDVIKANGIISLSILISLLYTIITAFFF